MKESQRRKLSYAAHRRVYPLNATRWQRRAALAERADEELILRGIAALQAGLLDEQLEVIAPSYEAWELLCRVDPCNTIDM
jgi:hypothetical protein